MRPTPVTKKGPQDCPFERFPHRPAFCPDRPKIRTCRPTPAGLTAISDPRARIPPGAASRCGSASAARGSISGTSGSGDFCPSPKPGRFPTEPQDRRDPPIAPPEAARFSALIHDAPRGWDRAGQRSVVPQAAACSPGRAMAPRTRGGAFMLLDDTPSATTDKGRSFATGCDKPCMSRRKGAYHSCHRCSLRTAASVYPAFS